MQWHQLDHMQTICTLLQTDNHSNTSSLNFYMPDALPNAQPCQSTGGNVQCDSSKLTHTHTQPFNSLLSRTTWVGQYQKKHSPTHTYPDHRTSFITFLHLQRYMASFLFSSKLNTKQIASTELTGLRPASMSSALDICWLVSVHNVIQTETTYIMKCNENNDVDIKCWQKMITKSNI